MAILSTVSPVGNNTTGTTLPAGARSPVWNGVLFEPHYVYSPQLIFIGRYETIRMSQQCDLRERLQNLGNISTYTIAYALQPIHDQPRWFCLA